MNPATANPTRRPFHLATTDFAAGRDTPRAYLERCLERIAELEPKIGAFVALNLEGARAAADRATARWRDKKTLSPIDGMPVGIKDIIETEDMPTEQGSPLFAGYRTGRDAATVVALREAGAVVVGKTVTTEFAASEPRGTRNPWDLDRTPGGSSSGSAASVAVGMLPSALGTQVVGSILRPSSFCGVVGFKPSLGAINRGGSYDGLSQSCDGALAATLADAWLTLREIFGASWRRSRLSGPVGPARRAGGQEAGAARLARDGGVEGRLGRGQGRARGDGGRLRAAGVELVTRRDRVEIAKLETELGAAMQVTRSINDWEGHWPINAYRGRPGLSQVMIDRLAHCEAMSLEEYQRLLTERARIRSVYAGLKPVCDGCITLTAPGAAPVGLGSTGNPIFVVPGSLLGVPALSLPLLEDDGLPLGLQVLGYEQEDAAAFAMARWIDATLGGEGK